MRGLLLAGENKRGLGVAGALGLGAPRAGICGEVTSCVGGGARGAAVGATAAGAAAAPQQRPQCMVVVGGGVPPPKNHSRYD